MKWIYKYVRFNFLIELLKYFWKTCLIYWDEAVIDICLNKGQWLECSLKPFTQASLLKKICALCSPLDLDPVSDGFDRFALFKANYSLEKYFNLFNSSVQLGSQKKPFAWLWRRKTAAWWQPQQDYRSEHHPSPLSFSLSPAVETCLEDQTGSIPSAHLIASITAWPSYPRYLQLSRSQRLGAACWWVEEKEEEGDGWMWRQKETKKKKKNTAWLWIQVGWYF